MQNITKREYSDLFHKLSKLYPKATDAEILEILTTTILKEYDDAIASDTKVANLAELQNKYGFTERELYELSAVYVLYLKHLIDTTVEDMNGDDDTDYLTDEF